MRAVFVLPLLLVAACSATASHTELVRPEVLEPADAPPDNPIKPGEPGLMSGLVGAVTHVVEGEVVLDVGKAGDLLAVIRDGTATHLIRVVDAAGPGKLGYCLRPWESFPASGDTVALVRRRWVVSYGPPPESPPGGMPFAPHPFGPWDRLVPDTSRTGTEVLERVCFVGTMGAPLAEGRRALVTHFGEPSAGHLETDTGDWLTCSLVDSTQAVAAADERKGKSPGVLHEGRRVIGWKPLEPAVKAHVAGRARLPEYRWEADPKVVSADTFELVVPWGSLPRRGQRFQVLRDGMHWAWAIVTSIADRTVTCRVDMADYPGGLQSSDVVASRLWNPSQPLRVALHGSFSAGHAGGSRDQFERWLRGIGAKVDDNARHGTEVVVVGYNLLRDEHYRRARDDLRFEPISARDVAGYFMPEQP